MTPSPQSSSQKNHQYQPLNHAWLDGTEQSQQQQPQQSQSQSQSPLHPHPHEQNVDHFGYSNSDDGHNGVDPPISLMEPLLQQLSTSTTTTAWMRHDPLLVVSSPPPPPPPPPPEQQYTSKNVMMDTPSDKKMVRFHSDVATTEPGWKEYNSNDITTTSTSTGPSNNHHNHHSSNHQLRQRNSTTTSFLPSNHHHHDTSTRLLGRYPSSNTNRRRSHTPGSSTSVWNVQHIHTKWTTTTTPPRVEHPDEDRQYYSTIDHEIGTSSQQDDDDDNGDDDIYQNDDDDDHTVTTHRNPIRHRVCCCCGSSSHDCYEFWNTWFYTLAYQRTIILILILFMTYTGIVLFYATIYYTISRIGQAIHEHDHHNPHLSTSSFIATATNEDHHHNNYNYPDTFTSTTVTTNSNTASNNTTGHTTEIIDHTLLTLLLYLFCDMDLHTPMEAIYFSLSTMASIGYGVSDYYFGNCGIFPLFIVLLQICTAICYDAIAIGLLFQRLRRSHKRSKSILFTHTAVVQRVQSIPYWMIRIAELRHYPLVNATIRAYCIYHDRYPIPTIESTNTNIITRDDSSTAGTTTCSNPTTITPTTTPIHTTYYVTKPMILLQQDILMNIPQVIVHPIRWNESPLCPPSIWYDAHGTQHTYDNNNTSNNSLPKDDNQHQTNHDHHGMQEDMEQIQRYIQDRNMEIIIVIEGTDELTGTCTQTKQSYTYQDIQWNHQFMPCMYPANTSISDDPNHQHHRSSRTSRSSHSGNRGDGCIVDFASFHAVGPAPLNSDCCPYIS